MRAVDADELKKCAIPCEIHNGALTDLCVPLYQIDNAPTVAVNCKDCDGYEAGYSAGLKDAERPKTDILEQIIAEINSSNRGTCDYYIVDRIEEIINEYQKGGAE